MMFQGLHHRPDGRRFRMLGLPRVRMAHAAFKVRPLDESSIEYRVNFADFA
jgi:hypothetical protein